MRRPKGLHPDVKIYDPGYRGDCLYEDIEQMRAVTWFNFVYPEYENLFFHVPNEGDVAVQYRPKMKKMGVTPGIADLVLLVPMKGHPYAVFEMKREGAGYLSEDQKKHLNAAAEVGAFACMCRGAAQFEKAVLDYLD